MHEDVQVRGRSGGRVMATVVEELSKSMADVAARVAPSVVGVGAGGSGVVVGPGLVVTNAHNIRREEVVVTFADGRRADGRPAGVDVDGDLAVVAVDTGERPRAGGGRRRGPHGRGGGGPGQPGRARRAGQRRIRVRARRGLPGPRRRACAWCHRAHRAAGTRVLGRAGRRRPGQPGRHRHPPGGRRLLPGAARGRRAPSTRRRAVAWRRAAPSPAGDRRRAPQGRSPAPAVRRPPRA